MFKNPEFQRYLWLNFSIERLILMPVIIFIILSILLLTMDGFLADMLIKGILILYFLSVGIWGVYEAALAPAKDAENKTLDFQKMSSISPWALSMGKLIGSVSYVWYSALFLLGALFIALIFSKNSSLAAILTHYSSLAEFFISIILFGFFAQAAAFFTASSAPQSQSSIPVVVGVITIALLYFGSDMLDASSGGVYIDWYAMDILKQDFILLTTIFFTVWLLVAIQRDMRARLRYLNSPACLILFLVMLFIYFAGLMKNLDNMAHSFFFYMLICFYLMLLVGASDYLKYKRFAKALKEKEPGKALENTPAWFVLFLMAGVVYLSVILTQDNIVLKIFGASCMFFSFRDGLVFHAIQFHPKQEHKNFLMVVYLLFAYVLLPSFFISLAHELGAHKTETLKTFFFPYKNDNVLMLLPVMVQVLFSTVIFMRVLKLNKVK